MPSTAIMAYMQNWDFANVISRPLKKSSNPVLYAVHASKGAVVPSGENPLSCLHFLVRLPGSPADQDGDLSTIPDDMVKLRVTVKPDSGLPTQFSGCHHPLQERARTILLVAVSLVKDFQNGQTGV